MAIAIPSTRPNSSPTKSQPQGRGLVVRANYLNEEEYTIEVRIRRTDDPTIHFEDEVEVKVISRSLEHESVFPRSVDR